MAIGNPYRPSYGANDWTARLPPGSPGADQGMVVQPYTDPGYGMPNPYIGNLNQAPGMAVGGYLLANQLMQPNQGQHPLQPNRLAPWSNFEGDEGTPQQVAPPPLTWEQQLAASRPAYYQADPRMLAIRPGTHPDTGEFTDMRWLRPPARRLND